MNKEEVMSESEGAYSTSSFSCWRKLWNILEDIIKRFKTFIGFASQSQDHAQPQSTKSTVCDTTLISFFYMFIFSGSQSKSVNRTSRVYIAQVECLWTGAPMFNQINYASDQNKTNICRRRKWRWWKQKNMLKPQRRRVDQQEEA